MIWRPYWCEYELYHRRIYVKAFGTARHPPYSFVGTWFYTGYSGTAPRFGWNVNKNPTRSNSIQIFIYCEDTLHVSGVTAPIIRSTKNCNRSLRYRTLYWYSSSLQRGPIRLRWRGVAVPVVWPVPEAALAVLVLLMMGAVTPETCRVTLQ